MVYYCDNGKEINWSDIGRGNLLNIENINSSYWPSK